MKKISQYFLDNMHGLLNAPNLQELIFFNVIYFVKCWGRENVQLMPKETFKLVRIQMVIIKCIKYPLNMTKPYWQW